MLLAALFHQHRSHQNFAKFTLLIRNQQSRVATRYTIVDGLRPDIVNSINQLLLDCNHYVEVYKLAEEIFEQQDNLILKISMKLKNL